MPITASLEREAKLGTDLEFELPDLRGFGARTKRVPSEHLRTRYFDTPDFRLWDRRITLRVRVVDGSGDATWTLKTAEAGGQAGSLDRIEHSWSGDPQVIPDDVTRILRGIVRRQTLRQVAELVTTRRSLIFQDGRGEACVELDDDVVTVVAGRKDTITFRQLEVELRKDDARLFEKVVGALRRAGAHPDDAQKLAKALDLPTQPRPAAITRSATLGDVIRVRLGEALDQLLHYDLRMRFEPSDPTVDDVHDARVVTRRLRAELKTARPALDPVWVAHTREELQWLAGLLGRIRDADVLARWLEPEADEPESDREARERLRSRLADERQAASRDLAAALADDRYLNLLDRLDAGTRRPPFSTDMTAKRAQAPRRADRPARRELPKLVRGRWRALERTVGEAGTDPTDSALHQIRIESKQVRYASEMAAPILGKPARRFAERAEALQTVLGEHHDAVAAEAWLRREAQATPAVGFVAGLLAAEQSRRQERQRRKWRPIWDDLKRPNLRAWLR